jgi:hypothetical protein
MELVGIGATSGLVSSCFGTSDAFKFNVGLTTTPSKEIMKIASDGSLTVGNSTAATSFTLTDIVGAAWQLITGNYNLSFNKIIKDSILVEKADQLEAKIEAFVKQYGTV